HFLAFGHVLHLLQDMGSVAHVRNDFRGDHVFYYLGARNLEEAGERDKPLSSVLAQVAASSQGSLDTTVFDAVDFWDTGAFTDPSGSGLAEVVNRNFFSASTIRDDGDYALPRTVGCQEVGASDGQTTLVELPDRSLATGAVLEPSDAPALYLSTPLVPRLARCRFHGLRRVGAVVTRDEAHSLTVIDDGVQRDYLERLFALVVDYTAKFMEFYFQPRIDVVPAGENRFALVNRSGLSMTFDESEVRVFYEDVDAGRSFAHVPCDVSGEVTLAEGDSVECDLAAAEYDGAAALPANRGDFTVVARGRLGGRGTAVTGDPEDWRQGDYVTLFKRVLGNRIAYETELVRDLEGGEDEDAEHQREIGTIAFDLAAAQAMPPAPTSIEDLITERLRSSLPVGLRDWVDFFAPSAEAGAEQNEGRISFSSDLLLEQGQVSGIPPGGDVGGAQWSSELRVVDAAGSPLGPAIVPPPGETPSCNKGCVAPWDLAADRLVYSTWLEPVDIGLSPQRFATSTPGGTSSSAEWGSRRLQITSVHGNRALGFERRGPLDTRPQSLFVADLTSTAATHILLPGSNQVVPCQPGPSDPCSAIDTLYSADARFSPDGTRAVMTVYAEPEFSTEPGQEQFDRRHRGDLYVANLAGSPSLYRLHDAGGEASYPVISPDGQWVAFQLESDDHLYVVPLAPQETSVRYRVSAEPAARLGLTWLPLLQLP
ncbi:MAG: TolB family protein, partial [Myxococcota bacterium]